MKTVALTIRGCPSEVHQALKKSATVNHRSLNGETVAWLERQAARKPVTGKEAAAILREMQKGLSAKDRRAIARETGSAPENGQ